MISPENQKQVLLKTIAASKEETTFYKVSITKIIITLAENLIAPW